MWINISSHLNMHEIISKPHFRILASKSVHGIRLCGAPPRRQPITDENHWIKHCNAVKCVFTYLTKGILDSKILFKHFKISRVPEFVVCNEKLPWQQLFIPSCKDENIGTASLTSSRKIDDCYWLPFLDSSATVKCWINYIMKYAYLLSTC